MRKALRTISITGTGVTSAGVVEATVGNGQSIDIDEVAAYGDTEYTAVPRSVLHNSDLTITFLNETGTLPSIDVGSVKSVTITYTMGDGKTTGTPATLTSDFVIVSAEPNGTVAVDGDRKATFQVTLRKHGPTASSAE